MVVLRVKYKVMDVELYLAMQFYQKITCIHRLSQDLFFFQFKM